MLGEGIGAFRHHDMIDDPNIDQPERRFELVGNQSVRLTGLRHAGGVVMAQDAGRRVVKESGFDDFAGVDARAVDCAPEQILEGDDAVLVIQPEHGEDFMFDRAEFECQELVRVFRRADRRAFLKTGIDDGKGGVDDFLFRRAPVTPVDLLNFEAVLCFLTEYPFQHVRPAPACLCVLIP
jgi:hypothetical protein